jgi:outer membrane protein assembly factor BamB
VSVWPFLRPLWVIVGVLALGGCAGLTGDKLPPLPAVKPQFNVQQAWSHRMQGPTGFPMSMWTDANRVAVASDEGQVSLLDVGTGKVMWDVQLRNRLSAGVGSDGRRFAVVGENSQLYVIESGQLLWQKPLGSQSYTRPLVAGERVFVLGTDRSVTAFDAQTGAQLWRKQRSSDPLALQQAGLLVAVRNTLVVGLGGRMVAMDPNTGNVLWDVLIGQTRGTNDIERLTDIVGGALRDGDTLCVRAFQSNVACVDAQRGRLLWNRTANGSTGVDGNADVVVAVESDSRIQAWSRLDGQALWRQDAARLRQLTAPLVLGRSVVVGDAEGVVHFFSRADGSPLLQVKTDGNPITSRPAVAGDTLIVLTRAGLVVAYKPE